MDYRRIYDDLIRTRRGLDRDQYTEKHHILPKSKGGSNGKDNIIRLTPREHLVAHKLLARIYDDRGMWFALMMMSRGGCRSAIGQRVSSREYELIRKRVMSLPSPWKGVKLSDEHKKKVSLGSPRLSGANHPMFGKKHTEETKKRMSESSPRKSGKDHAMYGRKHTEETKVKFSIRSSGINNPNADHVVRTFIHIDGSEFTGVRYDFAKHIGISTSDPGLSRLINGKLMSTREWRIKDETEN